MSDTSKDQNALPSDGWTWSFPSLTLITPEQAIKGALEQVEKAEKLMEEDKYEEAADLFAEAVDTLYGFCCWFFVVCSFLCFREWQNFVWTKRF